ncbi:MAG: NUDIX domain-containing protein [bacterium]
MNNKPLLTEEYVGFSKVKYLIEYFECDSFNHLSINDCKQCYAVAFHGDKIVIVNNSQKGTYGLVGGSTEKGESLEETLKREIQEESNMKVIYHRPIGYQRITDTRGIQEPFLQLRYFCIVEPYGPFISDPAGTVTKVLEINPKDYKKYFNWGAIGDKIIERSQEFKKNMLQTSV